MKPDDAKRPLSRDREEPLYRQLYTRLRFQILSGEFGVGGSIPPESVLIREYSVSRITVRMALDQLVREGLIDRQRGRGSFVRTETPETRSCLSSFTDQMLTLGRMPSTELLRLETLDAKEQRSLDLPFDADMAILLIERLRSVDGEKAGLVRTYLPSAVVPTLTAEQFARTGRGQSLLYVLEHTCGIVLNKGEETMIPVAVPLDVAERLGCPQGSAAILKVCVLEDVSENQLLYEEAYWSVAQTQLVQRYPNQS